MKGLLINDTILLAALDERDKMDSALLTVPGGKLYTLLMSNGTEVTINSSTEISFSILFNAPVRAIWIKIGEAFFNVNASAAQPFMVHLPDGEIKVLGTQFNVSTYKNNQPRISLVNGKAIITSCGNTLEQKPGFAATITGNGIEMQPFDQDKETSWLRGGIYLKNVKEDEWPEITRRYFGENLQIESALNTNRRRATIDKNEPIDSFLIQLAAPERIYKEAADTILDNMVGMS